MRSILSVSMSIFALLGVSLTGCGSDDKGTSGTVDDTEEPVVTDDTGDTNTDDTNEPPPCLAAVVSTDPLDGAVDVALDYAPSVVLSEADATAKLESDIPGTFTVTEDGLSLVWVADAALESDTTYTVTATTCTGSESFSFTTLAPEIPDHLVDRSWEFNLSDGVITEPSTLEALIGDSLVPGLLGVSAAGEGTVDLRIAALDTTDSAPHQDYCLATSDLSGAVYEGGAVRGASTELWVNLLPGDPVPVYNLDFSGVWSEDGTEFSNGTLQGQLDARYVADWIGFTADDLCSFLPFIGSECVECPDGEEYCVFLRVEELAGAEVSTTVIEVLDSDCEGCEVGEPVCE